MARTILNVVKLHTVSNLDEDFAQNSYVFTDASSSNAADLADTVAVHLQTFYSAWGGYLDSSIMRGTGVHKIEAYDITAVVAGAASTMGSPVAINDLTIGTAETATGLPSEVAVCLSFHSEYDGAPVESGSTRPRSRRMGRVYLGPLGAFAGDRSGGNPLRPSSGLVGAIIPAAGTLMTAPISAEWCVWSRAESLVRPVVGGWVDNAFDTQRRRGVATTARTLFPA